MASSARQLAPGQLVTLDFKITSAHSPIHLRNTPGIFDKPGDLETVGYLRSGETAFIVSQVRDRDDVYWVLLLTSKNSLGWTSRINALEPSSES